MLCHAFWSQAEYKIVCFISILVPLAQLFLDTSTVILKKKSEIVRENYFSSSENAIRLILLRQMCKYKHSLTKIETSYIVVF